MPVIEKRLGRDGKPNYRVRIRLKGHPDESETFKRKSDAERWAQSIEAAIREGRHFKTVEARRHTLADMLARYDREVVASNPKAVANKRFHLAWWSERLGAVLLADVTPAIISEARNALLHTPARFGKKRTPATVVRYMATLSHAFTIAINDWGWLDDSPMRRVRKPVEARGRERFLSDDERQALLNACESSSSRYLYAIVVLAISTGMRRGEIFGLRWPNVDFPRSRILLSETKNGSSRSVPLTGHAHALLAELAKVRHLTSDYVFAGANGRPVDLAKPWSTAIQKACLTDFRFHDLRHTAASYLAMNGATVLDIAAILGHKTLAMSKRYSHLTNTHTTNVVRAMTERIFGHE